MARFRLFEKREDRAHLLRLQAEDVFDQLRSVHPSTIFANTLRQGRHTKRSGGVGHDFWQYRDFQSTDAATSIDWKQSAKSDRLLIRQKEREIQSRISIWLQNDASMNFSGKPHGQTKYECGAVLSLIAAMLATTRHDPVTLSGAGAVSIDDLAFILDEAKFVPEIEDLNGDELFLIGDFLNAEHFLDYISPNKKVHLIQILDPVEIDLPFTGRAIFEQPDGEQKEQILNIGETRKVYQERLRAYCDDLSAYCSTHDWSYTFIRSGQDLVKPFLDLLIHGSNR